MTMTSAAAARARDPLPLTAVTIDDRFWAPRRELIRTRTLRHQEGQMRRPGQQFDALTLSWRQGDPHEPHIFWESDVAKWIEAASYCLATTDDPELDQAVDEAIELLAGAQQDDGYLNAYFTVVKPGQRFTDLRDAHELYCAGHLIEAGVAHFEATGKTRLLDIVRRYADLIDTVFSPDGPCAGGYCGHQEIELALVKLYRVTGERRYLELSRRLIDWRGQQPNYFEAELQRRGTPGYFGTRLPQRPGETRRFREYNQSHQPVADQAEAVGHSVRAMYMYSAMTDLAGEYDDDRLLQAVRRLWTNLTTKKLYVTGGIGSDPRIEGFGPDHHLPDAHGYAETCAAIGLVQWAQRMSNLTGHGHYIDTLERALYNGVLSGASADGTHYFYGNPLASDGTAARQEWFECACCPPNLARLLSELGRYIYAQGPDEAVINLYVAGTARFTLTGGEVTLRQDTRYPQDGHLTVTVSPTDDELEFTLAIRVPAWSPRPTVTVNGEPVQQPVLRDGYLSLSRPWRTGDQVEIDLGMEVRRTWAHPAVASAAGKLALERGPVVFCVEGVDHDGAVHNLALARDVPIRAIPDERTGVVTLHADATADATADGGLYGDRPLGRRGVTLTAVPYFSWGNRGLSDMTVWIRDGGPTQTSEHVESSDGRR
ncbi:glycoside hydrolase family 127 protein [Nonomuraea sp. CA-141351]|uniref:glycoside hydrolase family 127 protein n=1 Tax=Nonomuraea sp. CA-141351 TaxID=3239996 RepID=UPI003D9358A1